MARREERAYREYVSDEQRSQPRGPQRGSRVGVEEGCPARELCDESLLRDTRSACTRSGAPASRPRPRAAQVATQARARCRSTTRARRGPAEATRPEPRTCHQSRWYQLTLHYSWIDAHDTTRQAQARRFTRFGCRFHLADLIHFRGRVVRPRL